VTKLLEFDWTITMATRGYHVRFKDQVVRHFYDLETCHRFIKLQRAAEAELVAAMRKLMAA
jgi:hypothetical protein